MPARREWLEWPAAMQETCPVGQRRNRRPCPRAGQDGRTLFKGPDTFYQKEHAMSEQTCINGIPRHAGMYEEAGMYDTCPGSSGSSG